MSHTPGPWHLGTGSTPGSREGMAVCEGPLIIAEVVDLSQHAKARARLIAAAPDLLQWAKDAFAAHTCVCKLNPLVGGPVPCQTCQLGSLIAKATGGAQ